MSFRPYSVTDLILSPRQVATGSPAGSSLENVDTHGIAPGCWAYVETGPAAGTWQFDKDSTATPDGVSVIAPVNGSGRWLKTVGGNAQPVLESGTYVPTFSDLLNIQAPINPAFFYQRVGNIVSVDFKFSAVDVGAPSNSLREARFTLPIPRAANFSSGLQASGPLTVSDATAVASASLASHPSSQLVRVVANITTTGSQIYHGSFSYSLV